ncbi:MAG: protein kinase [Myxococcales bacterium]|nr:protein kinase [Polyangiaceae bacterium]MDW8251488.1 protein kinase [Myxococcales bacterium]
MKGSLSSLSSVTDIFPIGEVLSDTYEIRAVLGAGGMGQVFEAHDIPLNRRVAIKAPWPDLRESVRKEAQALAAIRHPSMVSVYAIGQHKGIEYVVMERIYGIALDVHLHRRRVRGEVLTILEALDLLIAIADGLTAVHRAGVAHRDIKPANIMLAPGNRLVLMDFGLFLPEFQVAGQTTVAGSPQYMAPEAISNEVQPGAGHLVDLYAFGIVAYEMLTGDVPFNSEDVMDVWEKHLTVEVPDVRKQRPDTPPKLAALLSSLLQKDPNERPQSIEAVQWQLRTIREAELHPPAARPPPGATSRPTSPIPVAPPPSPELSRAVSEPFSFSVLIADDNKQLQKILAFYVKKAAPDADIRIVEDGEAAIEAVRARPPHLLLLDLQMPKVNGIEVAMHLRGLDIGSATQIVSVSASAQEHDIQLLKHLGITRFIPKDIHLQEQIVRLVTEIRRSFPL